jgi:hypothetical protein
MFVNDGKKAYLDIIYRDGVANYLGDGYFYVGFYYGTISKSTDLSSIPGEPVGNGYARVQIERSAVGWPTLMQNTDGSWTITSKQLTMTASGGDIGPVNGYFLCTSSDNSGVLLGSTAFGQEITILNGETENFYVKAQM